ncbi:MAG: dUTP diphosphatase [Lachnospiraceae bacterium]|nr:dUTP diphosphatase [Lachnospiraceae bacterium]
MENINTSKVSIKKLKKDAVIPSYGTPYAAGADLYACLEEPVTIKPSETVMIPTGVSMAIPTGCAGLIYARSGLASKKGLAPANKVGVIDSDYRGEILVALHNHSTKEAVVEGGERVAQLVITPYIKALFNETDELDETDRGSNGFGSTGTK